MKSLLKILFYLLVSFQIQMMHAQPQIVWQKTIGGSNDDYVNFGKIFTLQDGNYIIVGTTASNDGDFGSAGNAGGYDGYAAKFTKDGNLIWVQTYGGSGDDILNGLVELPGQGFIVAGLTTSNDGDVSGNHGQFDGWILQLDQNGNLLTQQCYGGSGSDIIRGIIKVSNGNYVFAGVTDSNDGDISGNHGADDVWVAKWNQNGNLVWSKTYGGSGAEYVSGIALNTANKILVAGTTDSNDGIMADNNGFVDGFVFQLNQSGNVQWSNCFGGTFLDVTQYGIEMASDGNLVLPMLTLSTDGDAAENHGSFDALVVKVNSTSGAKIWSHCYGTALDEGTFGAMALPDGKLILLGVSALDGGIDATYDAMAIKVNADGSEIWTKTFGGSDFDDAEDGVVTNDGGYLLMCHTASYDGDVTNQHGPFDVWLVKLEDEELIFPRQDLMHASELTVSPNPCSFSASVQFNLYQTENISLRIVDVRGMESQVLMQGEYQHGKYHHDYDVSGLEPGIYWLQLLTGSRVENRKLIVSR